MFPIFVLRFVSQLFVSRYVHQFSSLKVFAGSQCLSLRTEKNVKFCDFNDISLKLMNQTRFQIASRSPVDCFSSFLPSPVRTEIHSESFCAISRDLLRLISDVLLLYMDHALPYTSILGDNIPTKFHAFNCLLSIIDKNPSRVHRKLWKKRRKKIEKLESHCELKRKRIYSNLEVLVPIIYHLFVSRTCLSAHNSRSTRQSPLLTY